MTIKLKNLVKEELIKEINKIHRSLEHDLDQYARKSGYTIDYVFPDNKKPDVCLKSNNATLFIGDAKDSYNEKPTHEKTQASIKRYIEILTENLRNNIFKEVSLAIATNDEESAFMWKDWLTETCNEFDLNLPMFAVEKLSENAYIIIDEHVSV
jgi:hypothetical protein